MKNGRFLNVLKYKTECLTPAALDLEMARCKFHPLHRAALSGHSLYASPHGWPVKVGEYEVERRSVMLDGAAGGTNA